MRRRFRFLLLALSILMLSLLMLAGCGNAGQAGETGTTEQAEEKAVLEYHYANKDEAVSCYLANEQYFAGFSPCDIQYKTQDKNGTLEMLKEYGADQMLEFTDEEKAGIDKMVSEMKADLEQNGYTLPGTGEITFIKSTQKEENDSGAYTHGTNIFLGQVLVDLICADEAEDREYGEYILWHEVFHCITRNNPDFRKDMYSIIHFTVQDEDFKIPPSVFEKYISNPDVEHHNSYATFDINGEKIDCFTALIAKEPFEKEGDAFFDCMDTALIPIDGSDKYYLPDDATNFWDVFGKNTDYVVDPEECMADNFAFAMVYGKDGMEYENPEIIEAIIKDLSK